MKTKPLFSLLLVSVLLSPCLLQAGFVRQAEVETGNTAAEATALDGNGVVRGNVYPAADVDFYSFQALAGDRLYAAVQTSFDASANNAGDSVLEVVASDGTTVLEADNNDGSFNGDASSIAGFTIPSTGLYYLKVRHASLARVIRPYDLYYRVQFAGQGTEVEPNDTPQTPVPLPVSGWVAGSSSSATDVDYYSLQLNAGDSVFLSLDLDPERDTVTWNGGLSFGLFNNLMLQVNDNGAEDAIDSEAFFMTVKEAGTYVVGVMQFPGSITFGTYHLSVSVIPAEEVAVKTYESQVVPLTIPSGPAEITSTLTVPDEVVIGKLRVKLKLTHNFMQDLDVHLVSPQGSVVALFTDIGSGAAGQNTQMDIVLDDEAALPPSFNALNGLVLQPEREYRLGWFQGMKAKGTWTLVMKDDAGGDAGILEGWALEIVPMAAEPAVAAPLARAVIYQTDFETSDGGFTHLGVNNEWEWGTPTAAPITTANSGTRCWKTDLDGTYEFSSNQDLISPPIDLAGVSGPILLHWAQKHQMENATFDHAYVEVREVGGANPRKVWEYLDGTMTTNSGNPQITLQESAGWASMRADISDYAGKKIEVRFHLESDTIVNLGGLAVDDVMVTGAVAKAPEIAVHDGASVYEPELADGVGSLDFGAIGVGAKSAQMFFTIHNRGGKQLTGLFLSKSGTNAADLLPGPLGVTSLAPGGKRTFSVVFSPQDVGARSAVLRIGSNDADEAPFEINLQATGMPAVVPVVDTMPGLDLIGGVQLNGTVNAGGVNQTVVFDHGPTKNYGSTDMALPGTVSTMIPEAVTLSLPLSPHATIHYRVRAFSNLGEAVGDPMTFTKPNNPVMPGVDNYTITPESTALLDVLFNDLDNDADALKLLKLSAVTPAGAGTAKIVNNKVQFTASKTFTLATLTYQVTDGFGSTVTGTVNLTLGVALPNPNNQFVTSQAGTAFISLIGVGKWTASEKVPWLSITPTSGDSAGLVTVTYTANKSANPRTGAIRIGGNVFTFTQAGVLVPHVGVPGVVPTGVVGGPYSLLIPFNNGPVTFQVKNMPPGLKINHATGEISGRPLKADTYNLIVSATNAAGKCPNPVTIPVTVVPLLNALVGTYHGVSVAHPQINGNRGDRIEFTVNSTAKVTGKVITGKKTRPFTTQLDVLSSNPASPTLTVTLPRPGGGTHVLDLSLDAMTNTVTGILNDGVNVANINGRRRVWSTGNPATNFATTYSFRGTPQVSTVLPQGFCFANFSVNATTGNYTLAGRLSDDTAFTTSSFVGAAGQGIIYHALYGNVGGVVGYFTITPGVSPVLNTLAGSFAWSKPAAAASSKDNIYRNGFFGSTVTLVGGAVVHPLAGQVILGLPNANNNATLDFTGGGLPVRQDPDITFSILNPSVTGFTNVATIPTTPNNVQMPVIAPTPGTFSGSFVVPASGGNAQRNAIFRGQTVNIGGNQRGYGYFILPKVPAVGEPASTAPRLSGPFELRSP